MLSPVLRASPRLLGDCSSSRQKIVPAAEGIGTQNGVVSDSWDFSAFRWSCGAHLDAHSGAIPRRVSEVSDTPAENKIIFVRSSAWLTEIPPPKAVTPRASEDAADIPARITFDQLFSDSRPVFPRRFNSEHSGSRQTEDRVMAAVLPDHRKPRRLDRGRAPPPVRHLNNSLEPPKRPQLRDFQLFVVFSRRHSRRRASPRLVAP